MGIADLTRKTWARLRTLPRRRPELTATLVTSLVLATIIFGFRLNFDAATCLVAAVTGMGGVYTSIVRWRITRLPIMLWLAFSLLIFVILYGIFTYDAIMGLSNAPWRYYLRFAHIGHYSILIALQLIKTKVEIAVAERAASALAKANHGD